MQAMKRREEALADLAEGAERGAADEQRLQHLRGRERQHREEGPGCPDAEKAHERRGEYGARDARAEIDLEGRPSRKVNRNPPV
jgi:hypothetical protein